MKSDKICIVGGGTAGWMTAATFAYFFPHKEISLIESPDVPTIGVGESTTQFFSDWLKNIEIQDHEWMDECNATYKYSVRFENWNEAEPFHFPFTDMQEVTGHFGIANKLDIINWFIHKTLTDCPVDTFAQFYCPHYKSIVENRIITKSFDRYDKDVYKGYQIDATKFADWLRRNRCQKVNHIIEHVDRSILNTFDADIFVDCTGFRRVLSDLYTTNSEWESFSDELPNDRAWTVRLPYTDKRKEMVVYTNCHALDNGWVWTVPLRDRLGKGYNFSSRFVSDEDALEEFKAHLGYPEETLSDYKLVPYKTGLIKTPWKGNVISIGLSGGFIEPLESNALLSVHDWVIEACKVLSLDKIRQIDINSFNREVRKQFLKIKRFVGMHYYMSTRDDTPYWRYLTQELDIGGPDKLPLESWTMYNLFGEGFIAAGHNYNPFDKVTLQMLHNQGRIDLDPNNFNINNFSHYDDLQETFPFAVDYYDNK